MSDLTIREFLEMKAGLEHEIHIILDKFRRKTGIPIKDILVYRKNREDLLAYVWVEPLFLTDDPRPATKDPDAATVKVS